MEFLVAERGGDFDALMASYRDLFAGYLLRAVPRDWQGSASSAATWATT